MINSKDHLKASDPQLIDLFDNHKENHGFYSIH